MKEYSTIVKIRDELKNDAVENYSFASDCVSEIFYRDREILKLQQIIKQKDHEINFLKSAK